MDFPKEILKKVKLLEINTRKLVNNQFAGEYHTAFKGQGMTFSEFREYVPGDDVRTISWTLTARTGRTYVKKYDEERELTLVLAVDISGSGDYGSSDLLKGEVMVYLAALLAFSAVKNKDHVGLLLFTDQVEHFVPPAKGRGNVQRILRDLLYTQPKSRSTRLSVGFQFLQSVLKKRATIFILSDFINNENSKDAFESSLQLLGKKHDVISVVVQDPSEEIFPDLGLVDVQDSETGEIVTVDSSSIEFKEYYRREYLKKKQERDRLLRKAQVDRINISCNQDYIEPLIQFFKSRRSRQRIG